MNLQIPRRVAGTLVMCCALTVTPILSSAQENCSYETCALRIRQRIFVGHEVLQGRDDRQVGRFSFFGFAPELPMLAGRQDSATTHYNAFRSGNNSGAWMELIGTAALIGALAFTQVSGRGEAAAGLAIGGSIPFVWGAIRRMQARDRLGRAIWWYNRSLQ